MVHTRGRSYSLSLSLALSHWRPKIIIRKRIDTNKWRHNQPPSHPTEEKARDTDRQSDTQSTTRQTQCADALGYKYGSWVNLCLCLFRTSLHGQCVTQSGDVLKGVGGRGEVPLPLRIFLIPFQSEPLPCTWINTKSWKSLFGFWITWFFMAVAFSCSSCCNVHLCQYWRHQSAPLVFDNWLSTLQPQYQK